jgi:hypothetical protein
LLAPRHLIFTALEGALIDARTDSFAGAEEALSELDRRKIPYIPLTSRTRAEIEPLRRRLGHNHPFVTENGGGIFFPDGYFNLRIPGAVRVGRYLGIAQGKPYAEVCEALDDIAEECAVGVAGFHHDERGLPIVTGLRLRDVELPAIASSMSCSPSPQPMTRPSFASGNGAPRARRRAARGNVLAFSSKASPLGRAHLGALPKHHPGSLLAARRRGPFTWSLLRSEPPPLPALGPGARFAKPGSANQGARRRGGDRGGLGRAIRLECDNTEYYRRVLVLSVLLLGESLAARRKFSGT